MMSSSEFPLPDDMDQLKSMVRAMAAQASRADALEREIETLKARNADADERIKRLMQILKAYDRARFGRRSEKLGSATAGDEDAQQAFLFEEIETGISALRTQVGKGQASQQKRSPRPRRGFPPHLERIEVVIEPDDLPEHAGKQKVLIGEDVAERLDVIPAKFRVIHCPAVHVYMHERDHPPPEIRVQRLGRRHPGFGPEPYHREWSAV